jgi:hypothetical protein
MRISNLKMWIQNTQKNFCKKSEIQGTFLGPHLGRIGPTEFVRPYLAAVLCTHKINISLEEGNIMYSILCNTENKIKGILV